MKLTIDWTLTCRICLKHASTLVPLIKDDEPTILNTIKECLSVQLSLKPWYPNKICNDCITHVRQIEKFRETCVNSERILESTCGDNPAVKEEVTSTDVKVDVAEAKIKIEPEFNDDWTDEQEGRSLSDVADDAKDTPVKLIKHKCDHCEEKFTNKKYLVNHAYTVHHVCKTCRSRFDTKSELTNHRPMCELRYACHVCGQTYAMSITHSRNHFFKCREAFLKSKRDIPADQLERIDREYKRLLAYEQARTSACLICRATISHRNLQSHYVQHQDASGKLTCPECAGKYSGYRNFRSHMKSAHAVIVGYLSREKSDGKVVRVKSEDKRYACAYCKESFDVKNSLDKHLADAHRVCLSCRKKFDERGRLLKHRLRCPSLVCDICQTRSKYTYKADMHFLTCAKAHVRQMNASAAIVSKYRKILAKQRRCIICDEYIPRKAFLTHCQTKHRDANGFYTCPKCHVKISTYTVLSNHVTSVHKTETRAENDIVCFNCNSVFACFRDRRVHVMRNHTNEHGRIVCAKCSATSLHMDSFSAHCRNKHGMGNRAIKVAESHVCSYCGTRLKNKRNLAEHIKNKHETDEKRQCCHVCSAKFLFPYDLRLHVAQKHTTERNVKCEVCEKTFAHPYMLSRHRTVHNQRSFKCEICSNGFKTINALNRHAMTHDDAKYPCTFCDKLLASKRNLTRHLRTHTDRELITCHFCSVTFDNFTSHRSHVERYHKMGFGRTDGLDAL